MDKPGPPQKSRQARQGPRPLPLHLMTAIMTWTGSRAVLPLLRNGSLNWNPELRARAADLAAELGNSRPEDFERALDQEIQGRLSTFLAAIETYRSHSYRRQMTPPPCIWQDGSTRLLDYGVFSDRGDGPPLLVVPSLINRAYILDLAHQRSLLRWLAAQGFRPLLVDWGEPAAVERGFSLTHYIAGRLDAALSAARRQTGGKPLVVGYCMGGLLALALALRRPQDVCGLALLATPWDFHAESPEQGRLLATSLVSLAPVLKAFGVLPVDLIQAFFSLLDPLLVARKFLAFSRLDPSDPKAEAFVALEDWLNDGVSLAAPVARECLAGWYGENVTKQGLWRVAGEPVLPGAWSGPSLCVIPAHDRIVPPGSARALAEALPECEILTPPIGHIGMVASARAPGMVWQPFLTWLKAHAAKK